MWWVCLLVSLVTVPAASDQHFHHDSYGGQDPDDSIADEAPAPTPRLMPEAVTRFRRYVDRESGTFNQDIDDVQGAIQELFSGRNVDFVPKRSSSKWSRSRDASTKFFDITMNATNTQQSGTELMPSRSSHGRSLNMEQDWYRQRAFLRDDTTTTVTTVADTTVSAVTTSPAATTTSPVTTVPTRTTGSPVRTESTASIASTDSTVATESTVLVASTDTTIATESTISVASTGSIVANESNVISTSSYTETEETTTVPTTSPKFNIDALLEIVANLTYDYDTNLTEQLNETLQRFSIPTCATPTTITTTTVSETTPEMWYSTTVVAKCFVCGMDSPGIPQDSYCADAFATDFLPLLPVDARAKGHIARFRKYCRYFDVNNFQNNRSDPRAMLGRWTGGCAVRWIDLSGVYTQRTCRNRLRPATGRHYGSKRMAKLELTLSNVDDGCIISPMATLVPLSRGVSLYARFHACVCSGNWCNRAEALQQWTGCLYLVLLVVVEVVR